MFEEEGALIKLSEHPRARFWKMPFEELSGPEQVFRCVWEMEGAVNDKGFLWYLSDGASDTAFAAVAALLAIEARHAAEIVQLAFDLFEGGAPPRDQATRQSQLQALPDAAEALDELDRCFYASPDDVVALLYDYVMRFRHEIPGLEEPRRLDR